MKVPSATYTSSFLRNCHQSLNATFEVSKQNISIDENMHHMVKSKPPGSIFPLCCISLNTNFLLRKRLSSCTYFEDSFIITSKEWISSENNKKWRNYIILKNFGEFVNNYCVINLTLGYINGACQARITIQQLVICFKIC